MLLLDKKRNKIILLLWTKFFGLADKYNDFGFFLPVLRKFKYSRVYIFHIIYPEKSTWNLLFFADENRLFWFCRAVRYIINFICKLYPENSVFSTTEFTMGKQAFCQFSQ